MSLRWQLRVPESHYDGFRRLSDLTDTQFASLHSAIRDTAPVLPLSQLVQEISSKPGVTEEDVAEIVPMVASLYILQDELQIPFGQFVKSVMEALDQAPEEVRGLSHEAGVVQKRLATLMQDGGPLTVVAKAQTLATENARTFLSARIVSDVRPLFADDPTIKPPAAIVVHTLKITFVQDGRPQEFFVSLGLSDLRQLQSVLNRAEKKATSVEAQLESLVTILREEEEGMA